MLTVNNLVGFGSGSGGALTYRYLRFHQTANVGALNPASLWELDYSADGGTTYVPTATMTSNTAPSPLVASSDLNAVGYEPYRAFDNASTTGAPWKTLSGDAHPHWITIDLGAGNGITPNRVRFVTSNDAGDDLTPKDFTIQGSNTGAFTGEQTTLFTKTNEVTQPDRTTMTYSF